MAASRIPIRIIPPAIPKMPEMNEVDTMAVAKPAAIGRLIMGVTQRNRMPLIARLTALAQTRLFWP
jgi:hypothetical protein